jgi:hypothetical protein
MSAYNNLTATSEKTAKPFDNHGDSVSRNDFIKLALLGFPLGIAIGAVFTLLFSLPFGDGLYHPVTPALLSRMPNELVAVLVQYLLCGIFGAFCSGSTPLFRLDNWSLTRRTAVHFLCIAIPYPVTAAACGWYGPDKYLAASVAVSTGIFVVLYLLIWLGFWLYWRNWVKRANARLN